MSHLRSPAAIALPHALRCPFIAAGAHMPGHLQLHQHLGQRAPHTVSSLHPHLPEPCTKARQVPCCFRWTAGDPPSGFSSRPDENHLIPDIVNRLLFFPHTIGRHPSVCQWRPASCSRDMRKATRQSSRCKIQDRRFPRKRCRDLSSDSTGQRTCRRCMVRGWARAGVCPYLCKQFVERHGGTLSLEGLFP